MEKNRKTPDIPGLLKGQPRRRAFSGAAGCIDLPWMEAAGLRLGHGKIAVVHAVHAVAPGGIDVIGRAVQGGHRPDVVRVGQGVAVDPLQL
ncbi:hypothetical protein SDC9_115358 [bioreactor metagenome]|uniref:Uncharacterized protein n=1 Tax=bioreactor metagenome TaxID=1076179 RepID=A0A645BSS6_9ZZZZ